MMGRMRGLLLAGTGLFATGYAVLNYHRNNTLYRGPSRLPTEEHNLNQEPVLVRIWKSNTKENEVGHASLQVNQHYLSLWPKYSVDPKGKDGMYRSTEAQTKTLKDDIRAEGREPDHTFEMHHLDRKKMIQEIEKIQIDVEQGNLGYCLAGRALMKANQDCLNCTTVVFKVLQQGGLEKIPLINDILTSPQALCDIIVIAEKNEQSSPTPQRT